jgi:hypothetical protein
VEIETESELCRGRTVVDLWRRTGPRAERRGSRRRSTPSAFLELLLSRLEVARLSGAGDRCGPRARPHGAARRARREAPARSRMRSAVGSQSADRVERAEPREPARESRTEGVGGGERHQRCVEPAEESSRCQAPASGPRRTRTPPDANGAGAAGNAARARGRPPAAKPVAAVRRAEPPPATSDDRRRDHESAETRPTPGACGEANRCTTPQVRPEGACAAGFDHRRVLGLTDVTSPRSPDLARPNTSTATRVACAAPSCAASESSRPPPSRCLDSRGYPFAADERRRVDEAAHEQRPGRRSSETPLEVGRGRGASKRAPCRGDGRPSAPSGPARPPASARRSGRARAATSIRS